MQTDRKRVVHVADKLSSSHVPTETNAPDRWYFHASENNCESCREITKALADFELNIL